MAKDGLSMKLENGVLLDRILAGMQQRVGTKLIYQSLGKGAAEVRKEVKKNLPKDKGQLRDSVKSGLRKKAARNRNTFMAAMFFKFMRNKGENTGEGGWYSHLALRRHKTRNPSKMTKGSKVIENSVRAVKPKVRKTIGTQLAKKIADHKQKEINAKLR